MDFADYSQKHFHLYSEGQAPGMVLDAIRRIKENSQRLTLADIGCGDGATLVDLHRKGIVDNVQDLAIGLDLSSLRLKRLVDFIDVPSAVSDATDNCLRSETLDMVISSQVIEHVVDDELMLKELCRVLKDGGQLYISSVIKKWYGVYFYRNNGRFRLDPTHVREYGSIEELTGIIGSAGFIPQDLRVKIFKFPVLDLCFKVLVSLKLMSEQKAQQALLKNNYLRFLRALKLPVFGYHCVEVLAVKSRTEASMSATGSASKEASN